MKRIPGPLRAVLTAAALALLLVGTSLTVRGATYEVAIAEFAFAPAELTITVGDTVTWTNRDPVMHTATSVNGAFDSGELEQGDSYSLTFTAAGTYDYLCTPHPSMTGRIVVVAGAATPSPSGLPNVALPEPDRNGPDLVALGAILTIVAAAVALGLGLARGRSRPR
jgi:amicyanin